jgi:ankyrin repeat protein
MFSPFLQGMTRLLISRGACVDIPSYKGTPLHVAASNGEYGILRILLDRHANVNIVLMFSLIIYMPFNLVKFKGKLVALGIPRASYAIPLIKVGEK